MKKCGKKILVFLLLLTVSLAGMAQCSICTKTASQLGKASAEGLNQGIVYLMLAPFAIAGYIGWRWWRQEKKLALASYPLKSYSISPL